MFCCYRKIVLKFQLFLYRIHDLDDQKLMLSVDQYIDLTFFLFLCGTVLLYRGLIWQNRKWMAFAGVCLGASVLTRLPNIVECALIIAVFYYGILKKKKAAEIWKDVAACVIGFVAAFLVRSACSLGLMHIRRCLSGLPDIPERMRRIHPFL